MADTKISALASLSGANVASGDTFPIVDVSAATTKGITASEVLAYLKLAGISLDDLSDAIIATPATSQVVMYNGSNWANTAVASAVVSVDSTNIANSASATVQGTLVDLDAAITSAAGTGIPATLFDAAGDLLVGSADNTGIKLTKGANYTALTVNGSGTVGYNDVRSFPQAVNTQTGTTYTAVLTDVGKLTTLNNVSSIAYTVPPASSVAFPAGTVIDLAQYGAGQVTVTAGAGVTINTSSTLRLRTQYSAASLVLSATADTWFLVGDLEPLGQSIDAQTGTTYTLVLTDAEKLVTLSNAGAITMTVPTNASVAFPIGVHIDLIQIGAGQVTVAAAGGVTVVPTPTLKLRAQYSAASLVKAGTNLWYLVGDLGGFLMPFNFGRRANQTIRTTRPVMVGPDTAPGGGGGGGTTPTAPSDVTVGVAGTKFIGYNNFQPAYDSANDFATWRTNLGYGGMKGVLGGGAGTFWTSFGSAQHFKHSGAVTNIVSAAGETGEYLWQCAYEGLAAPAVNGGGTNQGMFSYKRLVDPTYECYIGINLRTSQISNPPIGDWFNDTLWSTDRVPVMSNFMAGVKFLGGDGMVFDTEPAENWEPVTVANGVRPSGVDTGRIIQESGTGNYLRWTGSAWVAVTAAVLGAKVEQRGYEMGTGAYTGFKDATIHIYAWAIQGGPYYQRNPAVPLPQPFLKLQDQFWYGWMRAMKDAASNGLIMIADWLFYRPPQNMTNVLKAGFTQGIGFLSAALDAPTRSWAIPRFGLAPFSWCGNDGSASYPTNVTEPSWGDWLDVYRQWSMFGKHMNYDLHANSGALGPGDVTGSPTQSIYTDTRTNPPGNHAPRMRTATAAGAHISTAAPTLTATQSGSGTTRTISGTAAHPYGIHWVRAYIYPSGTPVYAVSTWNAGGGTISTNYDNAFVTYTLTLTGVTSGNYAIVQAQSPFGHQHSVVVSLGGTAPFRLYANTSLWNTSKLSPTPTFDADADATLSSLAYGINNGAFCHPFYRGVSTDPTWTVTSTEDHWGYPPRTVTIKAPAVIGHASGSDGVMTILDSTTGRLWDFYGGPTINTGAHTITTTTLVDTDGVTGPGFGDQSTLRSAGTTAAGCPQASGTILATDVNNGVIPHGLFMAFDYTNSGGTNTSGSLFVPPAVFQDIGGATGPIPQGGLMVAQGSEPVGLNAMEHQLWLACTTYGVYNCDQLGGHPQFYGDGSTLVDNAFTDAGLTAIGRKLRLVRTSW